MPGLIEAACVRHKKEAFEPLRLLHEQTRRERRRAIKLRKEVYMDQQTQVIYFSIDCRFGIRSIEVVLSELGLVGNYCFSAIISMVHILPYRPQKANSQSKGPY